MAEPNGAVSCSPSYVTAESRSTMKAASDQPVRSFRQTGEPRTQLRPALVGLGRDRTLRAVDAVPGVALLRASLAGLLLDDASPQGADPAEPAEVDLEQFRVAQPRDAAEEHHAEQGEDGIAPEQRGDRCWCRAIWQDQLGPDRADQEGGGRPATERGG